MKLSDTFPKKSLYRIVLAMPIEVEVEAVSRYEAEDEAWPHAFEMLQDFMDSHDLSGKDFEVLETEIHPDLD